MKLRTTKSLINVIRCDRLLGYGAIQILTGAPSLCGKRW